MIDTIPATIPATAPTIIPPEPTMPAQIVSEIREDGLLYIPDVVNYFYSSHAMALNFFLDESAYPGMQITYDISTNLGSLYKLTYVNGNASGTYHTTLSLENNTYVRWIHRSSSGLGNMELINEVGGAVFVDAVIRADGRIVGYGLFEIGTADAYEFAIMRSETVIFPMIDGQLQEVSEEYVAEKLTELKQTVTPFDLEAKKAEYEAYLKEYWEQQKSTEPTQP